MCARNGDGGKDELYQSMIDGGLDQDGNMSQEQTSI